MPFVEFATVAYPMREFLCVNYAVKFRPGWNVHQIMQTLKCCFGRSFQEIFPADTMKKKMGTWGSAVYLHEYIDRSKF